MTGERKDGQQLYLEYHSIQQLPLQVHHQFLKWSDLVLGHTEALWVMTDTLHHSDNMQQQQEADDTWQPDTTRVCKSKTIASRDFLAVNCFFKTA